MATVEQMVAADVLVRQANVQYEALRRAWYAAFHADDIARMDRLDVIRLRALARFQRRFDAYKVLVYGEAR